MADYSVLFSPATTLVAQIAKAHADGRLEDKLPQYTKPKLLMAILDRLLHHSHVVTIRGDSYRLRRLNRPPPERRNRGAVPRVARGAVWDVV